MMNARSMMTAQAQAHNWRLATRIPLRTFTHILQRFSNEKRPNTKPVSKALGKSNGGLTRFEVAEQCGIGKDAARHELEKLVAEGAIQKTRVGRTYTYSLAAQASRIIKRKDGQYAMYCPSCGGYNRFTHRVKTGVDRYEYVCKCGYEKRVDSPMEGVK